ncbi:glycosyl transferase [Sphaerisporangium krabiense]|uniref:Glycosyltransferase involved in cell wall biosynthesis n=1 Tax=Sphaerisporangium krabiense TaxID=763782 RepID=A0A7W9DSN0_9ACTN|nr:glycosyltransferase family 2 protein [Sphaerisporangium krabiense]MBB5629738.1 glycosyltransferase involved in cell wall biosynthesis [Sphaerisporangium krabiense]GII63838.1 glycosyl transferase [Sphaerisporangium krabiense]
MITLSVVVPVRDAEPYIADALTSLRLNARPDFEFIVVDDGSVDATPRIIEDFRAELPGLTVLRNATAVGLADARNHGLSLASGRYVTFLDGDDWVGRGYLAALVAAIEGLGCDFVRVDHVQVEGRKRVVHRAPEARRGVVLKPRDRILPAGAKTMVDYPYAWAGVYRRELGDLLTFPGHLHTAEDRPWIWRLHREARSFAVVSLAGVFYRRLVSTSLTQIGDERQLHFFNAFELVFEQVENEPDLLPKAVRTFCALLAHHLELSERFSPDLLARFTARAREVLATLPPGMVDETGMEPERAELLRPLLPPTHRG